MPRNLLVAALLVELVGCWTSSQTPDEPLPSKTNGSASTASPQVRPENCAEHGDRLLIVVCRRGDDLAWTIKNITDVPLWAFVAPPAGPVRGLSRENAVLRMIDGNVLLTKLQFAPVGGEPVFTGVVALAPGVSDTGVVPLGVRVNTKAKNFTGRAVTGTSWVLSVALEIGFAEQRPGDQSRPAPREYPFLLLTGFDRKRQTIVRSPELRWR